MTAGGFDGISPGLADLAEHGHQVAETRGEQETDLGVDDKAAFLQKLRDLLFGGRQGKAADGHRADERVTYGAGFGDANVQAQVGILEYRDFQDIARYQQVRRLGEGWRRLEHHQRNETEGEKAEDAAMLCFLCAWTHRRMRSALIDTHLH